MAPSYPTELVEDKKHKKENSQQIVDIEHPVVDDLLEQAWHLRNGTDDEQFFELLNQARELCETDNYFKGTAHSLVLHSVKLLRQHLVHEALTHIQEAKLLVDTLEADIWTCRLYVGLSEVHLRLNQTDKALEYAKTHLDFAQDLDHATSIAAGTLAIGIVYSHIGNFEEAIACHLEAANCFEQINDSWGTIVCLINVSEAYRDIGNFEKGEPYAQKAMDLADSINNAQGLSEAHKELGKIFLEKQDYDASRIHFEANLKAATSFQNNRDIIITNLHLAKIPDGYEKQTSYIDKATSIATDLEDKDFLSKCYKSRADLAKDYKDFETAFSALEDHMQLEQTLLKESNQLALNNALVVFETEKARQETEIHRLKTVELEGTIKELELLNAKVKELSIRDTLTGLYNRRHLEEQVQSMFEQSIRYQRDFSICLLDIDYFKKINDGFSHQIGDQVLKKFAQLLNEESRSSDLIARFGGEEFIILMPQTSLENAHQLAERLRQVVEIFDWATIAPELSVTASFGISSKDSDLELIGLENLNPEKLISLADKRLYIAKESGRNQVCSITPTST